MLYFMVYTSTAVKLLSPADLVALLTKSQQNNQQQEITGMLLYKDGNFMQVLEGEEQVVRATQAKIARDPRHRGLTIILQGQQAVRQFPNWSMAFRDLTAGQSRALPGYNEFLNTPLTGTEFSADPTRCQKLLLAFKRNM